MSFDDKLQTYIQDTEKSRINFLKEAYLKLPKEIQDKINDDDITSIAKGKKIEKTPELQELQKEQEKLFKEKEEETDFLKSKILRYKKKRFLYSIKKFIKI